MKKQILAGVVCVFLLLGTSLNANATFMIYDVFLTSNSVTFTIDGDMTGYSSMPHDSATTTFSIEYFGDIYNSDAGYAPNTWSEPVFDGMPITHDGNTGTWSGYHYSWTRYDASNLLDATATENTITVSTTNDYFDVNGTGTIGFYWGSPQFNHVELAMIDYNAAPVPEPGTIFLLSTGLFGLVGFRKKFKKN